MLFAGNDIPLLRCIGVDSSLCGHLAVLCLNDIFAVFNII